MEPAGRGRVERRLAAILAADVAGYSRLIGADEGGTLDRLKALRHELLDPKMAEHKGRLVKTTGDGLLVEFGSVVDALRCAVEVQREMTERNTGVPPDNRIELRIGINVGDIVVEDEDIFGDGVNVAARLEGLAEPGGICVAARVQEDAAGRLELTFEDLGEKALKNIARPIRVYRVVIDTRPATPQVGTGPPLPDKPSIAVLPFQNMSGDPEQEYFADGMVEEIITALSRIRWLFVIARNSSFTYKGQAVDVKRVGRELGVRYVLEGSVRKAGGRVRITAQLIDAESGTHLWADRFDGSLEDVFNLQDEVAVSVAGIIEPTLQAAEIRRSYGRPTNDLRAYDLYLQALPHWISWEKGRIIKGLDLLGRAIELDPHFGSALALAGWCRVQLDTNGWADDAESNRHIGLELARQALQAGADNPTALGGAAFVLARFGGDINAAISLIDRSLGLNPSFALGWFWSGTLRLYAGETDLAIEHVERSLRLSPQDLMTARSLTLIAYAHFFARRFDRALSMLLVSLEEFPTWAGPHRFLAACYAHMGRLQEARETVRRLRAITTVVMESATHWRKVEHRELLLSGLRLATDEET
jgi:TolB-like protein/class 3 adenylate cyclase